MYLVLARGGMGGEALCVLVLPVGTLVNIVLLCRGVVLQLVPEDADNQSTRWNSR
jgi:hypothetical protein